MADNAAFPCVHILFCGNDCVLGAASSDNTTVTHLATHAIVPSHTIAMTPTSSRPPFVLPPRSKTEVQNLLESAGFSRSNPYYVVQQGKVRPAGPEAGPSADSCNGAQFRPSVHLFRQRRTYLPVYLNWCMQVPVYQP